MTTDRQEMAARAEYAGGAATASGRQSLREKAVHARFAVVQSGGIPAEWRQAQSEDGESGGRSVAEQIRLGLEIDLSVWCDSAKEEHEALLEVLERRERGAQRPDARMYYGEEELAVRFPDTGARWQYKGRWNGRQTMLAWQRMGLTLTSRFDELPEALQSAVQQRMQLAARSEGLPDALAKVWMQYEESGVSGDGSVRTVQSKPGLLFMDQQFLQRLLALAPGERSEQQALMLQGWINPTVVLGLECAFLGLVRQEGRSDWASGTSAESLRVVREDMMPAGFTESEVAEAEEQVSQWRLPASHQYAMRQVFDLREGEVAGSADADAVARIREARKRTLYELMVDGELDERVRDTAVSVGLGVAMRHQAGLVDVRVVDGVGRIVSRRLNVSRRELTRVLQNAVSGQGRFSVWVDAEGNAVSSTRPRVGAYCGDVGILSGSNIRSSVPARSGGAGGRLVGVGLQKNG